MFFGVVVALGSEDYTFYSNKGSEHQILLYHSCIAYSSIVIQHTAVILFGVTPDSEKNATAAELQQVYQTFYY